MHTSVTFLVNLLQDVNVLRPLAYLAARDLGLPVAFLLSDKFIVRDKTGLWYSEIEEISDEIKASLTVYRDEFEALERLEGKAGFLVAGSESSLGAHVTVHNVFRMAPPALKRVTLQHGFECVGFRQSRDQDAAHGRDITFGADIVCGWSEPDLMNALAPSQRPKYYLSGPPMALQMRQARPGAVRSAGGIVCENLHSIRFSAAGDFKMDFMETFNAFCAALQAQGKEITLRPHPGGQYVVKNNVVLPDNVILNQSPIYKVDLSDYVYGISAPSSVLIDMMLSGMPVAVWHDSSARMDLGNYQGLAVVGNAQDWLEFSEEAQTHPERFLERQQAFLAAQKMPLDPKEVRRRFVGLFRMPAQGLPVPVAMVPVAHAVPEPSRVAATAYGDAAGERACRVLFVAYGNIPSLQISFTKPLAPLIDSGQWAVDLLTERDIQEHLGLDARSAAAHPWVEQRLAAFDPDLVVFCRYSGAQAEFITGWARIRRRPVVFHIDDDLLNIPRELGQEKYRAHNRPERLATVRALLDSANVVYASTARLAQRMRAEGARAPILSGRIYASGTVLRPSKERPVSKIGYMGFDHAHDFELVLPALVELLRRNPSIQFELFGSIPKPAALDEFGDRVTLVEPVRDYEQFLHALAARGWDIGICPLISSPFNLVKADTKWVEYTSTGAAVVASRDTVYDECCANGCGLLAETPDEWLAALESLIHDPSKRHAQVLQAQRKLESSYSTAALRTQVRDVFMRAWLQTSGIKKLLFVASNLSPTLQLSFFKPLKPLLDAGDLEVEMLLESEFKERALSGEAKKKPQKTYIREKIARFAPDLAVFCRYGGRYVDVMLDGIRQSGAPVVFHIDDDLLNIPADIGEEKYQAHNRPERLATVRTLLDSADLVYASTPRLQASLKQAGARARVLAGQVYASGIIICPATETPSRKVGYMASADHTHNLLMVLPAIETLLDRNPEVVFEFFGSIPVPPALERFGARVRTSPPVANYENFLREFAAREWDVGICPLVPIHFNLMKANTKWVEYTAVGAAVVASRSTVYDECCANGCGLLAETTEEWLSALESLVRDPQARFAQVRRAQNKLASEYTIEALRVQVLEMFGQAHSSAHESVSNHVVEERIDDH